MLDLHFSLAIEQLEVKVGSLENDGNKYVNTWHVAIICTLIFLHSGIIIENEDN